jgi:arylsulfatase A-like enzyme
MLKKLLFMLALCPALSAAQPNFVMVFIDDMGWGDFSCFGNKTRRRRTSTASRRRASALSSSM